MVDDFGGSDQIHWRRAFNSVAISNDPSQQ